MLVKEADDQIEAEDDQYPNSDTNGGQSSAGPGYTLSSLALHIKQAKLHAVKSGTTHQTS